MTNEDLAFVEAIIDAPLDDSLRLMYADWLEERGKGAYAQFIRVQIQIAVLESQPVWAPTPEEFLQCTSVEIWRMLQDVYNTPRMRKLEELQKEEARLLTSEEWRKDMFGWGAKAFIQEPFLEVNWRCDFRGGFPEWVRLSLQEIMGQGLMKELFVRMPITQVTLSGRIPQPLTLEGLRYYSWAREEAGNVSRAGIPHAIFERLTGDPVNPGGFDVGPGWRYYIFSQRAVEDLSRACIGYARDLCGLPEVKWL